MPSIVVAVAAVVATVALVAIGWSVSYNRFVTDREEVADAWAAVDVELTRRHELVPQLVDVVQRTATHERELLQRAMDASRRGAGGERSPADASRVEPAVATALAALVALRERYPALSAQQAFLDLQHRLAITEDRIAAARRFYNTRVAEVNRRIAAFPSRLVARRHGIAAADYFDDGA